MRRAEWVVRAPKRMHKAEPSSKIDSLGRGKPGIRGSVSGEFPTWYLVAPRCGRGKWLRDLVSSAREGERRPAALSGQRPGVTGGHTTAQAAQFAHLRVGSSSPAA